MAGPFLSSGVPAFFSSRTHGWPNGLVSKMILASFLCVRPFYAGTARVRKGGDRHPQPGLFLMGANKVKNISFFIAF